MRPIGLHPIDVDPEITSRWTSYADSTGTGRLRRVHTVSPSTIIPTLSENNCFVLFNQSTHLNQRQDLKWGLLIKLLLIKPIQFEDKWTNSEHLRFPTIEKDNELQRTLHF
nr:hypothetical transcript [Hymenolepis microstoma]